MDLDVTGYRDAGPHIYREASRHAATQQDRDNYHEAYLQANDLNQKLFLESLWQARLAHVLGIPQMGDQIADFTIYDAKHEEDPDWSDENIARRKDGPVHEDYIVNDAHDNITHSLTFFQKLGIDSFDGKGMPVKAAVHVGQNYNNSYYTRGTVNFGDGDGWLFKDDAKDLTVVAHELGHGIVGMYLGGLVYWGQSGALNESFADILGVSALQYVLGEKAVPQASWLFNQVGMVPYEDENGNEVHPALRSLKAPGTAYVDHPLIGTDPQPADMSGYYAGSEDNYGVHINSGIPNHAFYLAATKLGGQGWDTILPVWIETARVLPARTNFKTFAETTLRIAKSLYEGRPDVVRAIRQAWNKVRVLGPNAVEIEEVYDLSRKLAVNLGMTDDKILHIFQTATNAENDLKDIEGVTRVTPGFDITEDLEIKLQLNVYVSTQKRKWREIPEEIEGYPVKVVYREAD